MKNKIKHYVVALTFILLFVCGIPQMALAKTVIASGNCGKQNNNVTWKLEKEQIGQYSYLYHLTFSGKGEMQDYTADKDAPWITELDPDSPVKLVFEAGITRIGSYSFDTREDYIYLYDGTFTLPNTITSLGENALRGLTVDTFIIPGSIKNVDAACSLPGHASHLIFQKGTTTIAADALSESVKSIVFPEGLTQIDEYMCAEEANLTSVILPESLTRINDSAFTETGLKSIRIPKNVTYIGEEALSDINTIYIYSASNNLKLFLKESEIKNDPTFNDSDKITIFGYSNVKNLLDSAKYKKVHFVHLCTLSEHRIQKVNALAPTDKQNGNIAHYKCSECDAHFSDAYGKNKLSNYSWVLPPKKSSPKLLTQVITHAKIKTYKASKLKKKATTIKLNAKSNGNGKLTYKVISKKNKKYIKVSKKGVVTLKKGCKKGKYQIRIRAAKTSKYNPTEVVVTITVKK